MGDETQNRCDVGRRMLVQQGAALAFALICFGFVWQARSYPYMDDTGPGAGFFAMWVGGLGLMVGVLMVALPLGDVAEDGEPAEPGAGVAIAVTLAALAAAVFLLEPLGFRLTSFLLLTVLLRTYGGRWTSALLFGAITSLLVFQAFDALRLRLPIGLLGI